MAKSDHATIYDLSRLVRRMARRLCANGKDVKLGESAKRYLKRNGFAEPKPRPRRKQEHSEAA